MQNSVLPTITTLLRLPTVKQISGKGRSTLYRDIQKGLFTPGVEIGGSRVAWPSDEIQKINQARIAGKSDDEIKALVKELVAARGAAA